MKGIVHATFTRKYILRFGKRNLSRPCKEYKGSFALISTYSYGLNPSINVAIISSVLNQNKVLPKGFSTRDLPLSVPTAGFWIFAHKHDAKEKYQHVVEVFFH